MPNNSIQLWSPDTCRCVIHLTYDDTLPLDQRALTYVTQEEADAIVKTRRDAGEPNINPNPQPPAVLCPAHAHLGHTAALLQQVLSENQRKNMALAHAQEIIPSLEPEDYEWSFDTGRILQISLPKAALNAAERSQIQNLFNSRFGQGKARIR